MTVEYLPRRSSELSAVEECWRQGKDNLLVSKYYPSFTNLKGYYKLLQDKTLQLEHRQILDESVSELMLVCID